MHEKPPLSDILFGYIIGAIYYGAQLFFVGAVATAFMVMLSPQLLPGWAAFILGAVPAAWFIFTLAKHTKDGLDVIMNAVIIGVIVLITIPALMKAKENSLKRSEPIPAKANGLQGLRSR